MTTNSKMALFRCKQQLNRLKPSKMSGSGLDLELDKISQIEDFVDAAFNSVHEVDSDWSGGEDSSDNELSEGDLASVEDENEAPSFHSWPDDLEAEDLPKFPQKDAPIHSENYDSISDDEFDDFTSDDDLTSDDFDDFTSDEDQSGYEDADEDQSGYEASTVLQEPDIPLVQPDDYLRCLFFNFMAFGTLPRAKLKTRPSLAQVFNLSIETQPNTFGVYANISDPPDRRVSRCSQRPSLSLGSISEHDEIMGHGSEGGWNNEYEGQIWPQNGWSPPVIGYTEAWNSNLAAMDNESLSSSESGGPNESLLVRIGVPELQVDKCLQFRRDDLIWEVKQQCLSALPKELNESFNYGLFLPPAKGKAGKFLDEERRLREYPMEEPIGFLELKYKSRVYKTIQLDEKQMKAINSKANLKKFVDHVTGNNVEKINKMCAKGLDPNFHCQDSGETPLTLATGVKSKTVRLIMALINGGAIIDYRTKDGSTAMHTAVVKNNCEALRTLLDLGAGPNYKDGKGLTPLYLSMTHGSDTDLVDTLLHDHAQYGLADLQGWQEVHQACKNGLLQHLERLLYYGADKNAQNAPGNTPLHVCAVNSQESCAKSLLFRGADKEILNFAGQTAFQTAVIANDARLAELIQNHKASDVIPFKDTPSYNPRRRPSSAARGAASSASSSSSLARSASDAASMRSGSIQMESPVIHSLRSNSSASGSVHSGRSSSASLSLMKPPSPSPSDRSIPPFSSGSSVSEVSSGGSTTIGSTSGNVSGGMGAHGLITPTLEDEQLDSASTLASAFTN
eukprot:maker-scaffold15_size728074-snap-gene-4.21 protein:Tk08862 transcript:maker-scaffold15_size728074-snap-gene-4.21-mRNA-1 annotation:"sh3 and multiple ankyrin repeat domains protein 3 isoform x2"